MANTDFSQWNPGAANIENDSTYQGDAQRTGGAVSGVFASQLANKLFYQLSTFVRAFALMLVSKGFSPVDGTSPFTADASSNAAVTALETVLSNVLTTADYITPLRALGQASHTGTTTLDTVYTIGPTALALTATQVVRITLPALNIQVQGAGTTGIAIKLNGNVVYTLLITSASPGVCSMDVKLTYYPNSGRVEASVLASNTNPGLFGTVSGSIGGGGGANPVLTGSALTVVVTAQSANNSDTQVFNGALVEIL